MIIDSVNISSIYKATLLFDSLKSAFSYPKLKVPQKNNWAEFDGLDVDLVSPVLDKKEITLKFVIDESGIDNFVAFLMAKTYRTYNFTDLNTSETLRFSEVTEINKPQGKCTIKVKLYNDSPLNGYVYQAPLLTADDYGFTLDSLNFSKYGIIPLEGSDRSLDKTVEVKKKLEVSSKFISGVQVSQSDSKRKEHKAMLNLYTTQTVANFLIGYNAFLYDFVRPDIKVIGVNGKNYNCYYESSKIKQIVVVNGIVWCNFSLNIVVL